MRLVHLAHDVLIVGAGPAGAHLALRLARAGRPVALLDARHFPRPKPCGEFLGPDCLPLLEELGLLEDLDRAGARPIRGLRLFGHGHRVRGGWRRLGAAGLAVDHGRGVRREVLDEQAVRAARREPNVRLLEGWSVGGLLRDPQGRVLGVRATDGEGHRRELRAPFTVGADGLRSRVARSLGVWERVPWLERFALTLRASCEGLEEHGEVHFVPGGYLALSPVDGGLATVNLVIDAGEVPRGRGALRACFDRHLERAPELRERLRPAAEAVPTACGPLAARTRACTFDGAALVGDACGYVDPITGEGTFFAMQGAALLAGELLRALRAGRTDRAALRGYERARRRAFAHRRALGLLLQRGLRHPQVVGGVLAWLERHPALSDLLVAVTGAALPPRALLAPSVWRALLAPGSEPAAGPGSVRE